MPRDEDLGDWDDEDDSSEDAGKNNVDEAWDAVSDEEEEAAKPAAKKDGSESDDSLDNQIGDWDDDGGVVEETNPKEDWEDDSDDDAGAKAASSVPVANWDADSDEEIVVGQPQQPGVAAVRKKIINKKKKHKFLQLADKVDVIEDEDEDPAARKKRMQEEQQKSDLKAAEDLFGGCSDSDSDDGLDDAFAERDFDRNANTGDPNFMAADFDEEELGGLTGGPSFQKLNFETIRLKEKADIDKVSKSLSDMLALYKENAPFVNILVSIVKSLGEKIDNEAVSQAVSALRRLSSDKDQKAKATRRSAKKKKRVEVPSVPKSELAARSKAKPPKDFWSFSPRYKEDYDVYGEMIGRGLATFYRSKNFPALISTILRDLAAHLEPEEIRNIINPLNRIGEDKRQAAAPKKKAPSKPAIGGAGKGGDQVNSRYDEYDYDAGDY